MIRGEHLAVRNAEGSFYVCQAQQNIYKTSKKITIQWFGLATEDNPTKDRYVPEYYDKTGKIQLWFFPLHSSRSNVVSDCLVDFETILTSVELKKAPESADTVSSEKKSSKKRMFILSEQELERIQRLLKRSVDKESGKLDDMELSEDNPDGRKTLNDSVVLRLTLAWLFLHILQWTFLSTKMRISSKI